MKQDTINQLVAPFTNVREKKGPWDPIKKERIMLKYIPGTDIIERLNEAFNYEWSFEVIDQRLLEDQVIVHGRLTVNDDESEKPIIKENFGSSIVKRYSSGDNEGKPIDLGFDFKGAATDCIKKCATMVGVALRIEDMEADEAGSPGPKPTPKPKAQPKKTTTKPKAKKEPEVEPEPEADDLPPVPDDLDMPVSFPGEKNSGERPKKPDYSRAPFAKTPEPSKKMETPEPAGRVDADGETINSNQLSVLKSMVVRKGKSESDIIKDALETDDAPETFEELTRSEAKAVLTLAYQLEDVPPEG